MQLHFINKAYRQDSVKCSVRRFINYESASVEDAHQAKMELGSSEEHFEGNTIVNLPDVLFLLSLDIDECADGFVECDSKSTCVNLPGWYHCECRDGYHDNGFFSTNGESCVGECPTLSLFITGRYKEYSLIFLLSCKIAFFFKLTFCTKIFLRSFLFLQDS